MQSLAEFLGASDPRPEDARPDASFEALADVADPVVFCQRVLETREFRQYIMNGIVLGDIPPAIMGRVMDHAWGKPPERIEVKDTTPRLEDVTAEQLEARALRLAEMARSIRLAPLGDDKTVH